MKKLNSIKLNGLNKSNLESRDMANLYGGNYCAFGDRNFQMPIQIQVNVRVLVQINTMSIIITRIWD